MGLVGAVGFEVLKAFAAFYIGRTTSKGEATYGTFAVVVGLLVFLNLVSRLVIYTAAREHRAFNSESVYLTKNVGNQNAVTYEPDRSRYPAATEN